MPSAAIWDEALCNLLALRTECATFCLFCTMAGGAPPAPPTHARITPIDVEGTLLSTDRDEIFAATGCSVATRDRGQGRKLTVAGPVSGLEEARRLALEACRRNHDHWLLHG